MKKKYYLFEMNSLLLNIISLVLFFVMWFISMAIVGSISFDNKTLGYVMLLLLPYFSFHEVLHSVGYVLHGANFKNITYGAHIEKGILCCLCKQRVSKKCILISLLYPFMFIGVITLILGIVFHNAILIILSVMNISGCSGDLIMFLSFVGLKDFEYSEYDNPLAFGLYSSKDLSKTKFFGLKYVDTKEDLEIKDLKKVSFSKTSIGAFVGMIILGLVMIFL